MPREISISDRYFKEGKLTLLPKKECLKKQVLDLVINEVKKVGQMFNEPELNQILKKIYDDFSILRRSLVDYGYLKRDDYGKQYEVINRS